MSEVVLSRRLIDYMSGISQCYRRHCPLHAHVLLVLIDVMLLSETIGVQLFRRSCASLSEQVYHAFAAHQQGGFAKRRPHKCRCTKLVTQHLTVAACAGLDLVQRILTCDVVGPLRCHQHSSYWLSCDDFLTNWLRSYRYIGLLTK